jgi:hypothetical protein
MESVHWKRTNLLWKGFFFSTVFKLDKELSAEVDFQMTSKTFRTWEDEVTYSIHGEVYKKPKLSDFARSVDVFGTCSFNNSCELHNFYSSKALRVNYFHEKDSWQINFKSKGTPRTKSVLTSLRMGFFLQPSSIPTETTRSGADGLIFQAKEKMNELIPCRKSKDKLSSVAVTAKQTKFSLFFR